MKTQGKIKLSKIALIRIIVGATLAAVAIVATLSVFLPSYFDWKTYYDAVIREKELKEYLNSLPLEFKGISAKLADGVVFYDNGSADPDEDDFSVYAEFTEKGEAFTEKLSPQEFTLDIPEGFSTAGGGVKFTYYYTPEKSDDESEQESEPVKAEYTLDVALEQPDASVYKVTVMPTFTASGVAENINGDQKSLPALNQTDYTVKMNSLRTKYRLFHADSGVTIKLPIVAEMSVITSSGVGISLDNVTCNFENGVDGLNVSYADGAFKLAATGDGVELQRIVSSSKVEITAGVVELTKSPVIDGVVVKSGATLKADGLTVNKLLVEEGATFVAKSENDALIVNRVGTDAEGKLELYGNVEFVRNTTSETLDKTGVIIKAKTEIFLGENSSVVFEKYKFAFASFEDKYTAIMYIPKGASQNGNTVVLNEKTLCDGGECTDFVMRTEIQTLPDYVIDSAPTATEAGSATHFETGETIVLPALNFTDYETKITNDVATFIHKTTGLEFKIEKLSEAQFVNDELTIDYNAETDTYTYTVAAGKTASFTSISANKLVFAGSGTFKANGNVTATEFTLENGVKFDVVNGTVAVKKVIRVNAGTSLSVLSTESAADCLKLDSDSCEAYFYGRVTVEQRVKGQTAVVSVNSKNTDNGDGTYNAVSWNKIYLGGGSDVDINGTFGLYQFSNNDVANGMGVVTVYYPKGAARDGNEITLDGYKIFSVTGNCNAKYEEVDVPPSECVGGGEHSYGDLVAATPNTCTESGLKAHYRCSVCEKYFTASKLETTLDALTISPAHDYGDLIPEKFATLEETGLKAHYCCSVCEKYFTDTKEQTTYDDLVTPVLRFTVLVAPTYTTEGKAKNDNDGTEEILPVLNDKNYVYRQTAVGGGEYKYSAAGVATFVHKATGIVITKDISDDAITFGWKDFNCVNIHFRNNSDGMNCAYENNTYILTLTKDVNLTNMWKLGTILPNVTVRGNGYTLSIPQGQFYNINKFTLDGANLTASCGATEFVVQSGTFDCINNMSKSLTINGGTVNVPGNVSGKKVFVGENGTLNVTHESGDSFTIANNGKMEIYGNVTVNRSGTGGTAFSIISQTADGTPSGMLKIGATARVTLNSTYTAIIGTWSEPKIAYAFFPEGATKSGNTYMLGDKTLVQWTGTNSEAACGTTIVYGDYCVATAPTGTAEGTVISFSGEEKTIPALNATDYALAISANNIAFINKTYAGVTVSLSLTSISLGDLSVDYNVETTTLTLTLAEGKTADFTQIHGANIVFAGAGTFNVVQAEGGTTIGVVASKSLTVNKEATLNITCTNSDGMHINAGAQAYLHGTVNVTGKGTSIWGGQGTYFYLSETSRVTTSGAIAGGWNLGEENYIKIYVPASAKKVDNKIVYADGAESVTLWDAKNGFREVSIVEST